MNPYLFVTDAEAFIGFLKKAFNAEEKSRTVNPNDGSVANCILKIGDSCFMISEARGEFEGMRTSFYLYVADVDAAHQRALQSGAQSVLEPADMDYNDRQSGIADAWGNYWWISQRLIQADYSE